MINSLKKYQRTYFFIIFLSLITQLIPATVPSSYGIVCQSPIMGLGDLEGGAFYSSPFAVSPDGSTVVGASTSTYGLEAFVWDEQNGMVGLGDLPGGNFMSQGRFISDDGSVIVGDSNSEEGAEAFVVSCVVNNPPDCSTAIPGETVIVSNSHKIVDVIINGITDSDGDAITLNVDKITQDEPTSGSGNGDKSPDGFGVGSETPQIRAERSGNGDGRVYEISFTADDGNGGSCTGTVEVAVPHDNGKDPIDSGQNYDSTLP